MWAMLIAVGLVHWLIMVTPGPNVLLVSHLAASGQRNAALWAAVGISAVAVLWATLAMLGINVLFSAQPEIRVAVQLAGGVYLFYLARRMWLQSREVPSGKVDSVDSVDEANEMGDAGNKGNTGDARGTAVSAPATPGAALRMGVTTNMLNPKSAVMFSSLFAAALPAQLATHQQAAVLGMVLCNALLWHGFLAGAFSHPCVQAVYARHRRWWLRLTSASLGMFGARLFWINARD